MSEKQLHSGAGRKRAASDAGFVSPNDHGTTLSSTDSTSTGGGESSFTRSTKAKFFIDLTNDLKSQHEEQMVWLENKRKEDIEYRTERDKKEDERHERDYQNTVQFQNNFLAALRSIANDK
jgi:hypothetical protein